MISLVGLPGSGKSTVGRLLARRLQLDFVDTDALFEQQEGCSIREFFEREGEAAFRDREQALIDDLTQHHQGVLATGGGAVLRQVNRNHLRERSHVLYLRSHPEDLFRRLRHDRQRPLLQVEDPQAKLQALFEERDPLYRETAHFVVETGRPAVGMLLGMVLTQLELAGIVPRS